MDRLVRACCLAMLCALVTACDTTTAQEHTADGRARLEAGELNAAVIELKNALQKDPDLADARMLLGEAQLQLGDNDSALKEFERALDLGLDNEQVRLGLLRSKVRLGRYQEVIGELEGSGALEPPFAVVLADAYFSAGDVERARVLYRQGEGLSQGSLGLALIAWQDGDLERAAGHLEEAVRLDPDNWQAWLRKGEFELGRKSYDAAEAAFTEAAGMRASRVMARVGLTRVDLIRGDLDAAAADAAELLRLAPKFVVGHYLDGLIKFEQGDMDGAEAAIREVQSTAPNHPPSLYLMGAIKYRQGQHVQAENNLARYLGEDPRNESAAKLLASTRFAAGNLEGTVRALEAFVPTTEDPQLLALHGSAHMRLGNPAEATRSLERSVELAPDMAPFRNQLALSLLASGDRQAAESELNSAIEVDGEQFQSDYLLAMVRLRERDWEAAAEAVEALVEKSPDSPIGYNLRGAVALGNGDREAARTAFRDALEHDQDFLPAVQNLARLAEADGNLDQAAQLYQGLLERNPGQENVLIALAELALRRGDGQSAVEYLEQSLDANPEAVRSGLGLARLHFAAGRLEDAASVVNRTLQVAPDLPDLLLLQAEIHLRSGNADGARGIARRLQSQVAGGADNTPLLLALGRLQGRLGEVDLARGNLQRVLDQTEGRQPVALQTLARLDLQAKDLEQARARLEQLQGVAADDPETSLLEADVLMAENRADEAMQKYAGLADAGMRDGVMRVATLSMALGDIDGAVKRLDAWLEKNPQDLGAQLLSADALMRKDTSRAMSRYEALIDTGNPVVLNNLAWLYMQDEDPRALEVARRAVDAAPDNADILDTLGWVLLKQEGDAEEAVRILRRSVQLNPGNPSVQYHLGMALRETGDLAGAREALSTALETPEFPEAGDAREALAAL